MVPKTINPSFDNALKVLESYHHYWERMGIPMLDLGKRPKGIRTDKDWAIYLNALVAVQLIGRRNRWIRWHVDGAGRTVFLLIDIPEDGRAK